MGGKILSRRCKSFAFNGIFLYESEFRFVCFAENSIGNKAIKNRTLKYVLSGICYKNIFGLHHLRDTLGIKMFKVSLILLRS